MTMTPSTSSLPLFSSPAYTDNPTFKPDLSTAEHDSLWKDYLDKATSFDKQNIEDWNKIVDVTLVFVGLMIAVLASFVTNTSQQSKPDPADVTNKLLIAIYKQLINNASTPINIDDVLTLNKSDKAQAVLSNALLYSSLGLCSVAAVLALAAKLWVTSYGHRVASGETPHKRAMERQKAYTGVLVWRMEAVIQLLPLILLIALVVFGFFVHVWIWKIDQNIGYSVGTLLTLSIIALGIVSLASAFIPACPYSSSFSTIIQFVFRYIRKALKLLSGGKLWLRTTIVIISWLASGSLIAYATLTYSSGFYLLVFIPVAITFEYATFEYATDDSGSKKKTNPQKYRLPHLTLFVFIIVASMLAAAGYFRDTEKRYIFIILYVVGMLTLLVYGSMARKMSKSLDGTTEIDAIIWLLKVETSPNPELFTKLARLIDSGGSGFQPKILESLMPLLSRVIVSHRPDMEPDDLLEAYVSRLAYLADFDDDKGSWWLLKEDAKYHPMLEKPLLDKLVELAKHKSSVGKKAMNVLKSYRSYASGHGEKPRKLRKRQMSGDAVSVMTFVESAHPVESARSYEEMELHPRRKGGYHGVDA